LKAEPSVSISKSPPKVYDQGGGNYLSSPQRLMVSSSQRGDRWRYVAAATVPLERNTTYWFLIELPVLSTGAPNQQVGSFKTLGQTVKVSFGQIYVLSDGDADSNGDLFFNFFACTKGTATTRPKSLGQVGLGSFLNPLDWGDGSRQRISQELTIENAPDQFVVIVEGLDNDAKPGGVGQNGLNNPTLGRCSQGGVGTGVSDRSEWNTAAREFEVSRLPGTTNGVDLYMRSKPLSGGAQLMFDVRGYVQVTRQ
jgi:hypothetical protein